MKTFLHLVRRELIDHRLFFAAALLAGFLPYLLASLAASSGHEVADLRPDFARGAMIAFFLVAPFLLGLRWLSAGLANGRRAFELARPIGAWQLFASKLSGILLVVLGGTLVTSLPTFLTAFRVDSVSSHWLELLLATLANGIRGAMPWTFSFLAIVLTSLTLGQSISFLLVGRSWRSLIDLGSWIFFALLLALAVSRLREYDATRLGITWLPLLLLSFCALGLASAWRSFQGGALVENVHGRHSASMSIGIVAIGLLALTTAYGSTRPDIGKLPRFSVALPSDDGSRWLVAGRQNPRGFDPAFLVDAGGGKASYLQPYYPSSLRFSADGRRLLVAPFGRGGTGVKFFHSTEEPPTTLPVSVGPLGGTAQTNADLSLLVQLEKANQAVVYELPSARRLGQVSLPVSESFTQVIHRQDDSFDFIATRRVAGSWDIEARRFHFDASRLALEEGETWRFPPGVLLDSYYLETWWYEALQLLDAGVPFDQLASSAQLTALAGDYGVLLGPATELRKRGESKNFRIVDARGKEVGSFDVRSNGYPVGEIRPGLLAIGFEHRVNLFEYLSYFANSDYYSTQSSAFETLLVEVPSGRIVRKLQGFTPRKFVVASKKVWLENRHGDPFDLAAADAEPQRVLPFRPLSAER